MIKPTPEALDLFHKGAIALAQIEANGARIDMDYLNGQIEKTGRRIAKLTERIKQDEMWSLWRKTYGEKANLGSRHQLARLLYKELGYEPPEKTKGGRDKADVSAFEKIDLPFLRDYTQIQKLSKAKGTYLEGIRREVVDGVLHPVFNLNTVSSYRSSSSDPNFQNIPVRDGKIADLIRRCFIARKGRRRFGEVDFKGIEVGISCVYHEDPTLIDYVVNSPPKDMHRDMAMECYMLPEKEVSKDARYCAKNQYVFPEFYGSYYVDCSRHLWESIDRMKLRTKESDVPLKQHLAMKGIKKLGACLAGQRPVPGTFEYHIQQVERDFWHNRFKVYTEWKIQWYEEYLKTGGFALKTGFAVNGFLDKNQVLNIPIQGVAFHCLLWTLIKLQNWLVKNKMRTLIVGQIHDSIIADIHENELDDYLAKVKEIVEVDLPKQWEWIIVPLKLEAEIAPRNASWFEKAPVEF